LPPDHRHEVKILIPITLLDMTTITVIDHGMSLSVLYEKERRPLRSFNRKGQNEQTNDDLISKYSLKE
jgi:hypothetical protein